MPEKSATWLRCLTDECRDLAKFSDTMDAGLLRRILVDILGERYTFPMRVAIRGHVVGERFIDAPSSGDSPVQLEQRTRFIEVVPEGYTKEAFELTGGFLVATDRPLMDGSVVMCAIEVPDPAGYELSPPAFLTRLVDLKVEVPVEP